ncbi:MAG: hypothetical protein MZV64_60120 [Ignavibacteriales bacterium]|nr:hypothetical protein [Ignavibacteriales bacterium]
MRPSSRQADVRACIPCQTRNNRAVSSIPAGSVPQYTAATLPRWMASTSKRFSALNSSNSGRRHQPLMGIIPMPRHLRSHSMKTLLMASCAGFKPSKVTARW